jgi:hypothetical protein
MKSLPARHGTGTQAQHGTQFQNHHQARWHVPACRAKLCAVKARGTPAQEKILNLDNFRQLYLQALLPLLKFHDLSSLIIVKTVIFANDSALERILGRKKGTMTKSRKN